MSYLIKYVKNDINNQVKEFDIMPHIDIAVGSIINNLLFSYRFDGVSSSRYLYPSHKKFRSLLAKAHRRWKGGDIAQDTLKTDQGT